MENKIYYFEEINPENSDILLALVKEKAQEKGVKHIVVASTRGETGVKAAKVFKDSEINVVVVTHQIGPRGPELLEENEKMIKALGVQIVTCTHAFPAMFFSACASRSTGTCKHCHRHFIPATGPAIFCHGWTVMWLNFSALL